MDRNPKFYLCFPVGKLDSSFLFFLSIENFEFKSTDKYAMATNREKKKLRNIKRPAMEIQTNICSTELYHYVLETVSMRIEFHELFVIISYHCSWMLCHVAAVKSLPALIYSADYILLLVL